MQTSLQTGRRLSDRRGFRWCLWTCWRNLKRWSYDLNDRSSCHNSACDSIPHTLFCDKGGRRDCLGWNSAQNRATTWPHRAAPAVIGSEEERARREYTLEVSKRALIDTMTRLPTCLLEAVPSIPGAQQCMNFIKEVHGENSVELVPAYLPSRGQPRTPKVQGCGGVSLFVNWVCFKIQNVQTLLSQLHGILANVCRSGEASWSAQAIGSRHILFQFGGRTGYIDTAAGYFTWQTFLGLRIGSRIAWHFMTRSLTFGTSSFQMLGQIHRTLMCLEKPKLRKPWICSRLWQLREKFLGAELHRNRKAGLPRPFIPVCRRNTARFGAYISCKRHIHAASRRGSPSTKDVESVCRSYQNWIACQRHQEIMKGIAA